MVGLLRTPLLNCVVDLMYPLCCVVLKIKKSWILNPRDGRWLRALVRDGGDDWRPRDDRRDRRWGVGDRQWGDRDGRPASLLVMLAPKGQREGAGQSLDLRWGEGEGEEPRRRGSGERDLQGRWVRGERWRPSEELVSRETLGLSHRVHLVGGDRRLVWGGGVRRHLVAPDPSPMFVKRTSRWIDCIDGHRCLLVLTWPYAEPVTPLGRQRDSAAAASRGPCSQKEQWDPLFAEVERHRQIVANSISCRPWTLPSTLGSSPG